ncbi:hypothetical protein BV22DRAFT_1017531 [Leucogyrophana mollusca]|uniref:Uncharacterized protein n=1 Tax=Leucogyrophana mollusca TaxID=85980 RepID=A0ACB8BAJ4_9AGAM|nr:hypothetical protein BV22DRAFT_1017531 [Leucogyrophana mollusca]
MSTVVSTPATVASSQNVTLPAIPELLNPNFLDVLLPPTTKSVPAGDQTPTAPRNPMMDALRGTSHHRFTENGAPAFSSTLSPTLDAFQGVGPFTKGKDVDLYLERAWAEDPDLTLRIIWCIRSIHDGKSDKELFYRAFGWLFKNHPRTAIANLPYLVASVCSRRRTVKSKDGQGSVKLRESSPHGYWKDLLNILALATVDELHPEKEVSARSSFLHNYTQPGSRPKFASNDEMEAWSRDQKINGAQAAHTRLVEKLAQPKFRALYVAVAQLFANRLVEDDHILEKISSLPAHSKDRVPLIFSLSLAGKWAPTPNGSHDRVTNISTAISILLHHAQVTGSLHSGIPVSLSPSPLEAHVLRSFYQRHILTPMRRAKSLPEPLMSANRWSEIIYSRVSSVCMQKCTDKFFAHDPERFVAYLTDVESGKTQISGATLLPHELVRQAAQLSCLDSSSTKTSLAAALQKHKRDLAETQLRVIEAQWKTLVARLQESGELDSCIAVCDVSGSMGSIWNYGRRGRSANSAFNVDPIWPAVSLSLLIARLAKPPFKDGFITFSSHPQFVALDPAIGLADTVNAMGHSDWGMNTNFNAVFLDLLLPLAMKNNIAKEDMIKRVFVFSDMQFDSAFDTSTATDWETNHDVIERAYTVAGYDVPEIVFWDLSHGCDYPGITAPVTGEKKGVALLNGFSPSLLKVFMDIEEVDEEMEDWTEVGEGGEEVRREKISLTPVEVMKKTLGRKSFDGLIVVD